MTISTKDVMFNKEIPVDLTVYVYTRPHMRDEQLEFELHMGRHVLDGIFDKMVQMPEITELFLSFPENWLNIIEQRALYKRLNHYCPNLKKLTIKTQSVYIIQCTCAECVRIMTFDEPTPGEDGGIDEKMWLPMNGNVFGKGLTILTGSNTYGSDVDTVQKQVGL
jgi:hypothetical protein